MKMQLDIANQLTYISQLRSCPRHSISRLFWGLTFPQQNDLTGWPQKISKNILRKYIFADAIYEMTGWGRYIS